MQQSRQGGWRIALATGAAVAAIPLVHGVGAGTWIYCVAPWATIAMLVQSRTRMGSIARLAASGLVALVILVTYRLHAGDPVRPVDLDWARNWQQQSAQLEDGWHGWTSAPVFIWKNSGTLLLYGALAGWGFLLVRRAWLAVTLLTLFGPRLVSVIANAHWWILPGSMLLYPERVLYWVAPGCALAVALAWRVLKPALPVLAPRFVTALACALLFLSAYYHVRYYQALVRKDAIHGDGWAALQWARRHLRPEHDLVSAPYNSAGSYLPGVAQVASTGAHFHFLSSAGLATEFSVRPVTHVLLDAGVPSPLPPDGAVVYQNQTITILEISAGR